MDGKKPPVDFTGLKNVIWAFAILICLFALLVGLIYAAVNSYDGDREYPTVQLGSEKKDDGGRKDKNEAGSAAPVSGELNELPKSKKAGDEYLTSLTFVCDSANAPLPVLSGRELTVWVGESGVLNCSSLSTAKIVFPDDGSSVSIANAAMISQPKVLVMLLGADGIADVTEDAFKTEYATVIDSVLAASPETQIICCSICPNTVAYAAADAMAPGVADTVNDWIRTACARCPVWYADLSSVLTESGYLKMEYAAENGRSLNADGVEAVLDYLCMHAVG